MRIAKIMINLQNVRYFRYSIDKLRNGRPKNGHIRHQRLLEQIPTFCFSVFSNFVINAFPLFSAVIFEIKNI